MEPALQMLHWKAISQLGKRGRTIAYGFYNHVEKGKPEQMIPGVGEKLSLLVAGIIAGRLLLGPPLPVPPLIIVL